jgi:serine phosphatase RsbU (regulator of sigma subunit)
LWFTVDHIGWGLLDYLDRGPDSLVTFVRTALPQTLLIELLPLPSSAIVALVYIYLGWPAFVLVALTIIAIALLTQRWADARNELMQRVSELSTIEQVSRAIAQAQLDVDEICRLMHQNASTIADATVFQLGLFDGDEYSVKLWIREGTPLPQRSFHLAPGVGLVNWLRESGQPILLGDFEKEVESLPARPVYVSESPPRSALFVPLIAEDTVIGTMSLQSFRRNAYGQGDLRVLSAMANQAAIAIQKARLYEAERTQAWLSTALLQVADAMSQVSDLDAVLTTIVRLTPMLVGVDRCAVLLWDPDTETFLPGETYGLSHELRASFEEMQFPLESMPALDLIRWDKRPLVVNTTRDGPLIPPAMAERFQIQEVALLPLLAQGELLGAMLVDYSGRAHSFTERMIEMLTGIANQAAMVIQSARLVQAQQEEAYVSMALLQVAEAVSRATDLYDTLGTIARITPMLAGVRACTIMLRDVEAAVFRPVQQYGLPKDHQPVFWEASLTERTPPVQQLLEGALYVNMHGKAKDTAITSLMGTDSVLALPLASKGAVLGLMNVSYARSPQHLTQGWLNILTGIAGQAAIAVENDSLIREVAEQERLKQELEVARRIQASFLPEHFPDVSGWDLSVMWRSAREVGGDFYDSFALPGVRVGEERGGVIIADVADKGVPAALFMALSRTLLRTMAIDGRTPGAAIARANNLIWADTRASLFVTAFYVTLQSASGQIRYVNAGHMPPLLIRAGDGKVQQLRTDGMALGVLPDIAFKEGKAKLGPGDLLVMYTDGVTEASNAEQQMFGLERLLEVATEYRLRPADELAQRIDQAVSAFVGSAPQFDDITLLVAKRTV